MPGFFQSRDTYVETIWSDAPPETNGDGHEVKPGQGNTAEVTYRPLNAGDHAAIQDVLRSTNQDEDRWALELGSMRILAVEKAVVDWTIPGAKPTPESIRQLAPPVFDQIYAHVRLGSENPTLPPSQTNGDVSEPSSEGDGG